MKNYSAEDTIDAALASLRPIVVEPVPVYSSPRSGLAVQLGKASPANGDEPHCNQPFVAVKIDGTVDYMDAQCLATFFSKLAVALEKAQ